MARTIKIIDLLNKISKGEEVPKKIKYGDKEYYRNFATSEQIYYYLDTYANNLVSEIEYSCELNYEVEIIEDTENNLNVNDVYIELHNNYWNSNQMNDLANNFSNHEIAIKKLIDEVNRLKEKLDENN